MNERVSNLDEGTVHSAGASLGWQISPLFSLRTWTMHVDDTSAPDEPVARFGHVPVPATVSSYWITYDNPAGHARRRHSSARPHRLPAGSAFRRVGIRPAIGQHALVRRDGTPPRRTLHPRRHPHHDTVVHNQERCAFLLGTPGRSSLQIFFISGRNNSDGNGGFSGRESSYRSDRRRIVHDQRRRLRDRMAERKMLRHAIRCVSSAGAACRRTNRFVT